MNGKVCGSTVRIWRVMCGAGSSWRQRCGSIKKSDRRCWLPGCIFARRYRSLPEQDILKRWESVCFWSEKRSGAKCLVQVAAVCPCSRGCRRAGDHFRIDTDGSGTTGISSDGCRGSFDKCRPPRRSGSAEDRAYRRKWVYGSVFQQREKSHASLSGRAGDLVLAYPVWKEASGSMQILTTRSFAPSVLLLKKEVCT